MFNEDDKDFFEDQPVRTKRWENSFLIGFIPGLIGPFIGLIVYWFLLYVAKGWVTDVVRYMSLQEFVKVAFFNGSISGLLAIGSFFNLAFFFYFLNKKWYWSARSLFFATIAVGITIFGYVEFR